MFTIQAIIQWECVKDVNMFGNTSECVQLEIDIRGEGIEIVNIKQCIRIIRAYGKCSLFISSPWYCSMCL